MTVPLPLGLDCACVWGQVAEGGLFFHQSTCIYKLQVCEKSVLHPVLPAPPHWLYLCTRYGTHKPAWVSRPFCHLIVYYTDTIIWTWTWTWSIWHLCIAVMYQHTLLHVIVTCSFASVVCFIHVSCSYMLDDEHSCSCTKWQIKTYWIPHTKGQ